MVIEWLIFKVPPEKWEAFIRRDEEVWTAGLKSFPGFLGKEIWVAPVENEVVMLIRWETRELWKSVPQRTIEELDAKMGELQMPIAESREYQVGKFLH
ncbi:TIGR03792 family protein [Microcoleus sp. herbarium14]|uniref:TIGR03792 family protein n=1 Tax=Microcoleus sp. herbarium14 TaxID=3055439 RepID=UPI002FD50633